MMVYEFKKLGPCYCCRQPKEEGRENESYCKACKALKKRERLARNRSEKGLRPYGSGRIETCSACKAIKESHDSGFCNACKRLYVNARYELVSKNDADRKDTRRILYNTDGAERQKILARVWTRRAIKRGYLVRLPCEKCGDCEVDAHHDDYDKPLQVRWLCRSHHRLHHEQTDKLKGDQHEHCRNN